MTKQNTYTLPEVVYDFLSCWGGWRAPRVTSIFSIILIVILTGTASGQDFTIIVLPDTQYYSEKYPSIFKVQTQWIVNNKNTLNIAYVAHTGDIVQHPNDESEWINADKAMSELDIAMIPYGVVPGNHDDPTTFFN